MQDCQKKIGRNRTLADPCNLQIFFALPSLILKHKSEKILDIINPLLGNTGMNYPEGKGGVYQRLINAMPLHEVFIESHLGGGAVMQYKRPAPHNIASAK